MLYTDKNMTPPSLNVVLFLAEDETFEVQWEKQLNRYVRVFR